MSRARTTWLSLATCLLTLSSAGMASDLYAQPTPQRQDATQAQQRDQQKATATAQASQDTATAQLAKAEQEKKSTAFVRLVRDKNGTPASLDTAITTYVGKNKQGQEIRVDLLGAIHIGDKSYYQELSKRFKNYDALLYELVAPRGARPGQDQESMYGVIARYLGLSDQLANIDYSAENFVHADMSGDEFLKSMEERGESFIKMFFKAMGQAMAQQQRLAAEGKSGPNDFDLIMAMLSGDKTKLKQVISPTFEDMEMSMALFEGPEGSTIITERNQVALKVLQEQIDQGKTKLGIFYGAGHFRDMESRLMKDFNLKVEKQEWIKAWNMSSATPGE
ncbi:MAG: hypothetical protein MPJ50_03735 [Pirellulales bacterium]|nr:hypothetical protein [Pirellulales bacterium]